MDGLYVVPKYYSLRYGNHCAAPKNWKLEGSADGVTFVLLSTHTNDGTLVQQPNSVGAWPIDVLKTVVPNLFNQFRLSTVTPPNSCFHVGCFEVYGRVILP